MAGQDWREWEPLFRNRTADKFADEILPYIKPDSRVVDIGCGAGNLTIDIARRTSRGHVVGIDHNEHALDAARAAAERAGIGNVEFVYGDVQDLRQYHDNTFDIAHAHQVMLHLPDAVASLRHMRRIVRPGGIVAVRDLAYHDQVGSTPLIDDNWNKFWKISRAAGSFGEGTGCVSHQWMHDACFDWGNIRKGVAAFDFEPDLYPGIFQGMISWARNRSESEEYISSLRTELDAWAKKATARFLWLDGWALGFKN